MTTIAASLPLTTTARPVRVQQQPGRPWKLFDWLDSFVVHVAEQLDIADASVLKAYGERERRACRTSRIAIAQTRRQYQQHWRGRVRDASWRRRRQVFTDKASGKLARRPEGTIAEFEHALMSERTMDGLEAARARGRPHRRQKPKLGPRQVRLAG
jgi:hypothetical protein